MRLLVFRIEISCLLTFFCISNAPLLLSQTHNAVQNTLSASCGGYYEYLPKDYDPSQSELYPLIIFLHGFGDKGNGKLPELNLVLREGLPKYISQGQFPESFHVDGRDFRFIVISPQFSIWPHRQHVQEVFNYILPRYKVDQSRVYITGMSMGGGVLWEYAQSNLDVARKIAAIVPVCGQSDPDDGTPSIMAEANLPVWATHNQGDQNVPVARTNKFIDAINQSIPAPVPLAKKTIFTESGHDAWTKTYNPQFREDQKNIYEWMLQYSRSDNAALPVKLSKYTVMPVQNRFVEINWETSFEDKADRFIIEHSEDAQHFSVLAELKASNSPQGHSYNYLHKFPASGVNFYRLIERNLNASQEVYKTLTVEIQPIEEPELSVYQSSPNWLVLRLKTEEQGIMHLNIYDYSGRLVITEKYAKTNAMLNQNINITGLQPGQYFIRIVGDKYKGVARFIRQ
jgi:pimeloyl-ACP methyl ester carboxylesterase